MATLFTFALTFAVSLALIVPSALNVLPTSSWFGMIVSTDSTDASSLAALLSVVLFSALVEAGDSSVAALSLPPQYFPSSTPMIRTAARAGKSHKGYFDDELFSVLDVRYGGNLDSGVG